MPSGYANITYSVSSSTLLGGMGETLLGGMGETLLLGAGLALFLSLLVITTSSLERYKRLKSLMAYIANFAFNVGLGTVALGASWIVYETLKSTYSSIHLTLEQALQLTVGILTAALVGYIIRKIIERIEKQEEALNSSSLAKK